MGLANCKECGGLFVQVSRNICDACYKEKEEILLKVQRYIKDHPKADIAEVAEANEIDEGLIFQFIREKRLVISTASGSVTLTCEACGTKITSGRFCSICRSKLGEGLTPPPEKTAPQRESLSRRDISGDSMIKGKFKRK